MTGPEEFAFRNDYLYFVVRPAPERGTEAWIYCSGVNVTRFSTLTRGLHGLSSNPVIRGLQLLKHSVSRLAISRGARPRLIRGRDCAGMAPTPETWYSEILLIENAPPSLPDEIITFCQKDLIERIIMNCCPGIKQPDRALSSEELQIFITSLSRSS